MAILMVAMLAFGGTYAYFTANAAGFATDSVTTGIVEITSANTGSTISKAGKVVSGSYILGDGTTDYKVTLTSKSNVATFVFATLSAKVDDQELFIKTGNAGTNADYTSLLNITGLPTNGENGTTWTLLSDGVYYLADDGIFSEGETSKQLTDFSCSVQVKLALNASRIQGDDPTTTPTVETSYYTHNVYTRSGTEDNYTFSKYSEDIMNQNVIVTLSFESIQQESFTGDITAKANAAYLALHPAQNG